MSHFRRKRKKPGIFNTKNVMGGLIVFIMVTSILGMVANEGSNNTESSNYNGFKLNDVGNYWHIQNINEEEIFQLRFHPDVVDDFKLPYQATNSLINTQVILLSLEPNDKNIEYIEQIRLELSETINDQLNKYSIVGVSEKTIAYEIFPVIGCLNATTSIPVVVFKTGNETAFSYENNCLIATGKSGNDLFLLKDRLLLGLIKAIE